jgi:hypothetical protein
MTTAPLRELLGEVEGYLPRLANLRSSNGFANDVYEAAYYWVDLGRWVLDGNTAVNFPVRASHELELLDRLAKLSKDKSREEQGYYEPLFKVAHQLLTIVSETVPPEEGHLGFLKIVGELFRFVEDFGFRVVEREPTVLRYSSGAVYLHLECSKNMSIACSFGQESERRRDFWIVDLLFMFGDARYRSIPQMIEMNTRKDVADWFGFIADVFRRDGQGILSNEAGVFERLRKAQDDRDAEYTSEMDRKYGGQRPPQ